MATTKRVALNLLFAVLMIAALYAGAQLTLRYAGPVLVDLLDPMPTGTGAELGIYMVSRVMPGVVLFAACLVAPAALVTAAMKPALRRAAPRRGPAGGSGALGAVSR